MAGLTLEIYTHVFIVYDEIDVFTHFKRRIWKQKCSSDVNSSKLPGLWEVHGALLVYKCILFFHLLLFSFLSLLFLCLLLFVITSMHVISINLLPSHDHPWCNSIPYDMSLVYEEWCPALKIITLRHTTRYVSCGETNCSLDATAHVTW